MNFSLLPDLILAHLLTETAAIQRVPAGSNNDTDREVVIASIDCSEPYEVSPEARERAGLGDQFSGLAVQVAVTGTAILENYRFVYLGTDYRILAVVEHPAGDPEYLELLLQEETL